MRLFFVFLLLAVVSVCFSQQDSTVDTGSLAIVVDPKPIDTTASFKDYRNEIRLRRGGTGTLKAKFWGTGQPVMAYKEYQCGRININGKWLYIDSMDISEKVIVKKLYTHVQ